jgi:PAS domain S-box-containing protein
MDALSLVARSILDGDDFKTTARAVFEACKSLTGASSGYVALLNPDGSENEIILLDADSHGHTIDPSIPGPNHGLRAEERLAKKPVFHNQFSASPYADRFPAEHFSLENVLFAPLVIDDRILGVIGLANKPGGFTSGDLGIAETFSIIAAVALKRHKDSEAMHSEEERFRNLVEATDDIIFTLDTSLRHTGVYGGWLKKTGMSEAHFLGRTSARILGPEAGRVHEEAGQKAMQGETVLYEWTGQTKNGLRYYQTSLSPLKDAEDRVTGLVGVGRDFTDLKKSEEDKAVFVQILDLTPASIMIHDYEGRLLYVNETCCRLHGRTPEEILSLNLSELNVPSSSSLITERMDLLRRSGEALFEVEHFRKDGSVFPLLNKVKAIRWQDQDLLLSVGTDISAIRKAAEELQESEDRFRLLLENAPDAVFVQTQGTFSFVNQEAVRLFGASSAENLIGTSILDRIAPQDLERARTRIREINDLRKPVSRTELTYLRLDGSPVPVETSAVPVSFQGQTGGLVFARDISERRRTELERMRLEDELRHSEKMKAVGQLAGGVAHDFNNLLQIISGNIELAAEQSGLSSETVSALTDTRTAVRKAADLVSKLLAFSSRKIMKPENLDLNDILSSHIKMLTRIIPENIRIRFIPAPQPVPVFGDRGMIEQVLMNLCLNSRDAMPAGGEITIRTGRNRDETGHECVILSVEDTGIGMTSETKERIFEPFFTTKQPGKGTGMGLATVFGIVNQHNAEIEVESSPGQGSVFRIIFPLSLGVIARKSASSALPAVRAGEETILVAEDDPMVADMISKILSSKGYRVLKALDGYDALGLVQHEPKIDLLVTDVIMPKLNGKDLTLQALTVKPDLKIIFASGYNDEEVHKAEGPLKGTRYIQKPFSPRDLLVLVREMLDELTSRP